MTLLASDPQRAGLAAFGLGLLSELDPPGAWEPAAVDGPLLHLRITDAATIREHWSGHGASGWEGTIDGAPLVVERGVAGDHLFVHGAGAQAPVPAARREQAGLPTPAPPDTRSLHHLCPSASVLRCAPAEPDDPGWWRLLLDSVLFTVALIRGYEALHAAAVATPAGAVAITAATGGGKSTLLSELMLAGLPLLADDVLALKPRERGAPVAYPAPPLMTVPSQRTVALAALPGGAPARIATVEDEDWLAVPVHRKPLPLRALIVLDRRPGAETKIEPDEQPLATLMQGLLRFPRTPERERSRFEIAAQIAENVPIWRLRADTETAPPALASRLLDALAADGSSRAA